MRIDSGTFPVRVDAWFEFEVNRGEPKSDDFLFSMTWTLTIGLVPFEKSIVLIPAV
jgi:hypothetical protein